MTNFRPVLGVSGEAPGPVGLFQMNTEPYEEHLQVPAPRAVLNDAFLHRKQVEAAREQAAAQESKARIIRAENLCAQAAQTADKTRAVELLDQAIHEANAAKKILQ